MKFYLLEDEHNDGFDMYLRLAENDDGEMALFAYPTSNMSFDDEVQLLVFRDDGLHLLGGIDVLGWPVDKNGFIKIIRHN